MLKWRRWEKWERGKLRLLVEWIYWIEKVGDRGRKERLWDVVGIEVRGV